MSIEITEWKPVRKNTLRGFLNALLPTIRLEIRDCAVHQFGTRTWVSLPAKAMTAKDGLPILNERTGKQDYFAFLRFTTRGAHDQFERQVIAGLLARHPDALDDDTPDRGIFG
jgi:hypothetical protein